MKTLQAVGWNWRTDGVEVCALVDGQSYRVFVPLRRVWHEFAKALAEGGTPMPPAVGGEMTVAGLFHGISCAANQQPAVGWFGSKLVHSVAKAATAVTNVALAPVKAIAKPAASVLAAGTHALSSVPVFGGALAAATTALTSPVTAVNSLVQGGKISSVAMNALKSNISSIRTLAPYAQTVISVVPGVGQGLSGAIGAGLALASGMSITDAVMAGVRDSLPGGPLARAAFDVANAAAHGQSISSVALAALPLTPQQKQILVQGVQLSKDLASGKKVSTVIVDAALRNLPADAQKAVQIAVALAHAKSLQQAVGTVAQASGVAQNFNQGIQAALQIARLPPHLPTPPSLVSAVQRGLQAKQVVQQATNAAAQGHAASAQFLSFLAKPHISGPLPQQFTARFHTNTRPHARGGGGAKKHTGIHHRTHVGAPMPAMKTFTARFHTDPPAVAVSGISARFVSGPWFPAPQHHVRQLYPVRMPYQTRAPLQYAWGR